MTIKSSGPISLIDDIVVQFEGTAPHSLTEYYRGGGLVPDSTTTASIPTSGAISFSDFYGQGDPLVLDLIQIDIVNNEYVDDSGITHTLNMDSEVSLFDVASDFVTPIGTTIKARIEVNIDSDTIFNNSVVMGGNFKLLSIHNSGYILGRGGDGADAGDSGSLGGGRAGSGNPGNSALILDGNADSISIEQSSYGYIAGGGNGGSGSALIDSSVWVGAVEASDKLTIQFGAGGGGGWNGGNGGDGFVKVQRDIYPSGQSLQVETPAGGAGTPVRTRTSGSRGAAGTVSSLLFTLGSLGADLIDSANASPEFISSFGTSNFGYGGAARGTISAANNEASAVAQGGNGGGALPIGLNFIFDTPPTGDVVGSSGDGQGGPQGNSVEKTGTIGTLTYVGSTANYYGTRDT